MRYRTGLRAGNFPLIDRCENEEAMICSACKVSIPEPGLRTVTSERNGSIIVFNDVPARICLNRGEKYFDDAIIYRLLASADQVIAKGAEFWKSLVYKLPDAVCFFR